MSVAFDHEALARAPGDDLYGITVESFPAGYFRVHTWTGREAISEPYSFDIVATVTTDADEDIERLALGRRACFVSKSDRGDRAFYGVIAAVRMKRVHETTPRAVQLHLRLVPRLWLLKRIKRTRIFQNMRVPDIVETVLEGAGISARWQLLRDQVVRELCTQYEESDLRFIQRLCAEAGILFYFPEGAPLDATATDGTVIPGHTVVFADDASFYPPIGGADLTAPADSPSIAAAPALAAESPPLYFVAMEETNTSHSDKITDFSARTVVKADNATYREYDPDRPMAHPGSAAVSTHPFPSDADRSVPAQASLGLEVYEHHSPFLFPKWSSATGEAALILRQKRRRASMAQGQGGSIVLAPAHRFTLTDHPAGHLDRVWAVTLVEHHGRARPGQGPDERKVYWNHFSCVPAEVTFIPPRPKRKPVQVALTATVVGPPGEEVHVDPMGQIRVQFHWDREGAGDDRSSCWIRTMQSWAGPGFGSQFIPRVGQEVVVIFEGGDPDKPIVIGAVNNGTHPPPFLLPGDKTRSGWRTQSSPGGGGSNELSFEDAAGKEQICVRASRNLDEIVQKNHTLLVRADEFIRVMGSRVDTIEKNLAELIKGDHQSQVAGNRTEMVTGNSEERVSGTVVTRIEGRERRDVQLDADLTYSAGVTMRVKGCMTTLVGRHDKKRSWQTHAEGTAKLSSLDATEVSSERELTLRVGKSAIRITSDQIELLSPAITAKGTGGGLSADNDGLKLFAKGDAQVLVEKKLVLKSKDGASLSMQKEVKVDGSQILLNSPEQAKDPPPKDPDPPTRITFKDDAGAPLAYQRFLVTMADGAEVSGMTDEDGKAELDLKSGGKVTFPDLGKAR